MSVQTKQSQKNSNPLFIMGSILFGIVCMNILFIILFRNAVNSYQLIQREMEVLKSDRAITQASDEIFREYTNQISIISSVFPNEQTFPQFLAIFEQSVQKHVSSYQYKFTPVTISEGDKLFLLFTLSIQSDVASLIAFFDELEKLPYMTHITAITAKSPVGFAGNSEYSVGLKLYVQNPFITN